MAVVSSWKQDETESLAVLDYMLNDGSDLVSPAIVEREARAVLQRSTPTDPLTGLYNGFAFDVILRREVARCLRFRTPLSLLFLDIDRLDDVNGRWGTAVGDLALCRVARALQGGVRRSDIACRTDGDEFAVVMPNAAAGAARVAAGRILALLRTFRSTALAPGIAGDVSASLGLADLPPQGGMSPGQLVGAAREALRVAKRGGGGHLACGLEP